jgi:hypothetical protein
MRRRDFIKAFVGVATAYPFVAGAERASLPVIGFVNAGSADGSEAVLPHSSKVLQVA